MNKKDLLLSAAKAVAGRGEEYGDVVRNHERIANYWSMHMLNRYNVRVEITPQSVVTMMWLMKIARLEHSPNHEDSVVDMAGYAACYAEMIAAPSAEEVDRLDQAVNDFNDLAGGQ